MLTTTLKLKVQPDDYAWLNAAAVEVNRVFNYCNEVSAQQAARWRLGSPCKRLSGYDLCYLTAGYTEFTDYIGADTIQRVCTEYANKRAAAGKARLSWRVSNPDHPKHSLGWVPWKAGSIALTDAGIKFAGKHFRVFERERLTDLPVPAPVTTKGGNQRQPRAWLDGCFAQDAVGDWYLCLPVKTGEPAPLNLPDSVGIDPGLKDIATDSDGWRVPAPRFGRKAQERLAQLQRPKGARRDRRRTRGSKALTRAHRKVARQRRDFTHKASARTVKRALKRGNGRIFIGDVSAQKLAQTRMAKSVLDACWGAYRLQIQYKCQKAGIEAHVVSERFSTQICSCCGALSGPKGQAGLAIREWTCAECGAIHDRDVNSARVIRSRGDHALVLKASGCNGAEPRRAGDAVPGAAITPNGEGASMRKQSAHWPLRS